MNNEWPELPSEQYGAWSRFYTSLGLISTVNLVYGLASHYIKSRLYLSESLVAVGVGVLFGPKGLDLLFPSRSWGNLTDLATIFYHSSRLVMAIQIMAAGVSLPRAYIFRHWKSLGLILGPVMVGMWVGSSLIVWMVFGGDGGWLTLTESFLLGACVTPTDPVLANSIIKGRFAEKHVPLHIRVLLSAESGANDGAALPLLFLPLLILIKGSGEGDGGGWFHVWMVHVWLYQIGFSILIGSSVGYTARKALQYSEYHNLIDKESFLVFSLALAMSLTGLVTLLGSNDLLAVFVAGLVFSWDDWFWEATREARIQEVVDSVFNLTWFIFLGTATPWDLFADIGFARLISASLLILVARRLPWVILYGPLIPELRNFRESCFAGWFGPMGVGAIFYGCLVTMDWNNPYILPIVWFIVLSSVVAHGVTVPLFHLTMTRNISFSWTASPLHTFAYNPEDIAGRQCAPPPSIEQDLHTLSEAITEIKGPISLE